MKRPVRELIRERVIQFFITLLIWPAIHFGYIWVQHHFLGQYTFYTRYDEMIPFLPWTIWIYAVGGLFYVMVLVFYFDRAHYWKAISAVAIAVSVSFIIFALFPSDYPRVECREVGDGLLRWGFEMLHSIDKPNNTFPSLHISITCIAALTLFEQGKSTFAKALTIFSAILICLSVLTTKQHFIADILGGLVVTGVSYGLVLYLENRTLSSNR